MEKQHFITVLAAEFLDMRNALFQMPRTKWHKFKYVVQDTQGVNRTVRFLEGKGFAMHMDARMRSSTTARIPADGWQSVVPQELVDGLYRAAPVEPFTGFGQEMSPATRQYLQDFEANHTGNHRPRNRRVSVPTAAGQPVRA